MNISIRLRTAGRPANPLSVDREAGEILGLSVIAIGETLAPASGQGSMVVDATTLREVAAGINARPQGVKCRVTHPEASGKDDIDLRIGYIRNARLTPRAVLADFHAHDPNNSHVLALLDIAEQDPGSCGLSIVSNRATLEHSRAGMLLRCPSIDAVDFVGEPAANPAGMLAASAMKGTTMTTTIETDPVAAARDFTDAVLLRCHAPLLAFDEHRRPLLDATGNPRTRQPSRQALTLAAEPLLEIVAGYLRTIGPATVRAELSRASRPELAKLALSRVKLARHFPHLPHTGRVLLAGSTGDVPDLLADSMAKLALTHYAVGRRSWRAWAKRGTVRDFRPATRVRVEEPPPLIETLPGESIEFAALEDAAAETVTLGSYTRGISLTFEALLNDDTQQLQRAGELLGEGAARLEDRLAHATLNSNGNTADGYALFSTAHSNVTTGTLSATSLGAACKAIASRTSPAGEVLDLRPEVLLVPTDLAEAAAGLLESSANAPRWEGEPRLRMVSSPYLDSTAQWFVGTDPARMAAVEMLFRTGAEEPQVSEESSFDTDGVRVKIRHDVAAGAVDYRCMVRSTGS